MCNRSRSITCAAHLNGVAGAAHMNISGRIHDIHLRNGWADPAHAGQSDVGLIGNDFGRWTSKITFRRRSVTFPLPLSLKLRSNDMVQSREILTRGRSRFGYPTVLAPRVRDGTLGARVSCARVPRAARPFPKLAKNLLK